MKKLIVISLLSLTTFQCNKENVSQEIENLKITSSSTLRQAEAPWDHEPTYLVDENPKTLWCADGSTATITFIMDKPIELKILKIVNGRALNTKSLADNSQVKKLKITSSSNPEKKNSLEVSLKETTFEKNGSAIPQTIELDKSLIGNQIELEILETYDGKISKNVCITSINFGNLVNKNQNIYKITNKDEIKKNITSIVSAKRHLTTLQKIKNFGNIEEKRPSIFCNFNRCINLYLNSDETFLLEKYPNLTKEDPLSEEEINEIYLKDPYFANKSNSGSYKFTKVSHIEGLELNLRFFDEDGNEQNEFWYLKNLKSEDKEYQDFKTIMGTNFKNFDPKVNFLFSIKTTKENGFHGRFGELEFFSQNIPIQFDKGQQ